MGPVKPHTESSLHPSNLKTKSYLNTTSFGGVLFQLVFPRWLISVLRRHLCKPQRYASLDTPPPTVDVPHHQNPNATTPKSHRLRQRWAVTSFYVLLYKTWQHSQTKPKNIVFKFLLSFWGIDSHTFKSTSEMYLWFSYCLFYIVSSNSFYVVLVVSFTRKVHFSLDHHHNLKPIFVRLPLNLGPIRQAKVNFHFIQSADEPKRSLSALSVNDPNKQWLVIFQGASLAECSSKQSHSLYILSCHSVGAGLWQLLPHGAPGTPELDLMNRPRQWSLKGRGRHAPQHLNHLQMTWLMAESYLTLSWQNRVSSDLLSTKENASSLWMTC